jgi:acetyl esterase
MLNPQLEAMMAHARAAGVPDLCELPPLAARGLYREICAAADLPPADVATRDLRIPGCPDGARHTVGLRVYTPRVDGDAKGPHPVVVYFHGGGYALGDVDTYDRVTRQLCADAQAVVVSVDYRLAPEHPYPAAFDDAWAALAWIGSAQGEDTLGPSVDTRRLAVAGDSAGAVIASVTTMLARDAGHPLRIAAQALYYPPAAGGHPGPYPSRDQHAAGPTLTRATMDYFSRYAFGADGVAPDWRGAPLRAPSLAGLPPALLLVASHDPLRDEALAYGQALAAAGTAVEAVEYHGLAHGFVSMAGGIDAARSAQRHCAMFLAQALR